MHKREKNNTIMKATISNTVVAFIYVFLIVLVITIFFSAPISRAISLINMVSIDTSKQIQSDVKIDLEHNKLENYPKYGTRYATLKIDALDVNLPLYYGDSLSVLRYGAGQSPMGYFPGEGGSILCMAHNTAGFLRRLHEIELGTKINIDTSYGNYTYTVYDTKIIPMDDFDSVPIQKDKEVLMLFTCHPINSIGHATNRFVAYASLD